MENNIEIFIKNTEFPIGTKEAARILDCSERTIKRHCKILKIKRLNANSGPYLIFKDDLEKLDFNIQDKPGRPVVYQ